ncbi:MAG: lytic transglycosylase domain-containing protein [Chitinispirillia bacterium]|nr:lytic transglycosylase domain-containing protein [Chitinispirillia bacterium]MCL2242390.1 lytic transglycosylase domain-containing protein [Chitinispirillia bacterium]
MSPKNKIDTGEQPAAPDQAGKRGQQAPRATKRWVAVNGQRVWVSELTGIVLVCILLAALAYVTLTIISNEHTIDEQSREIIALQTEKISMSRSIETMRERLRIIELLKVVIGRKASPGLVYKLADLVYTNSHQYGYSPELLLGVIAVESRFDPGALGRYRSGTLSGAVGLMQLKYPTALDMAKVLGIEGLKPEDLTDPETNIILGTAYLTTLISWFKNFEVGIMAYNLGPGTVRGLRRRGEQLPMEYYEKILVQYYRLKALGEQMDVSIDH